MKIFSVLTVVLLGAGLVVCSANVAQQPDTSANGNGRIKGTLTFYFNDNYGTKPDVGGEVLLVREQIELPDNEAVVLTSDMLYVGTAAKYQVVAHSVADGAGDFELADIPPGQYTIVMQSSHVKGKYVAVLVTTDKKGKPLKKPKVEQQLTVKDMGGRIDSSSVTVEAGKTVDESHDFGITVF